ncbi:hypothetical protein BaRGS_00009829, partial [Batillaria attramentaria]
TRQQTANAKKPARPLAVHDVQSLKVDHKELKKMQEEDESLKPLWKKVSTKEVQDLPAGKVSFVDDDGILHRVFEPKGGGEETRQIVVPQLLHKNKLLLKWQGPFPIEKKCGACDYVVRTGRDKTKLFHVNMLKKYVRREAVGTSVTEDTDRVGLVLAEPEGPENAIDTMGVELQTVPVPVGESYRDIREVEIVQRWSVEEGLTESQLCRYNKNVCVLHCDTDGSKRSTYRGCYVKTGRPGWIWILSLETVSTGFAVSCAERANLTAYITHDTEHD